MFADLSDKLNGVFKKLRGEARLTDKNIVSAVKEVRMALLEADVNYKVAKDFVARVEARALGAEVLASITPAQQFVKIVNDELTETLGGANYTPKVHLSSQPPTIILMTGLQGSGKTTTCGKLARHFIKSGKSVMLVACDIYRPAAIDQLEVVGKQAGADVYTDRNSKDAPKIATDGVAFAKKAAKDVVIIDTAGRLHIDEALMEEVAKVKSATNPHEIFYAADAMTGQDAVNSASEFNKRLELTGIILTKTDGDARGGAALSVKEVTGKPLVFIGTGERIDEFELFHPERMAGRILGMGDVVSLVERAQEAMEGEDAEALAGKIKKSGLDFEDMLKQFRMIKKMGSLGGIMKMIPGLGSAMGQLGDVSMDDKKFKHIEAMIMSMTTVERRKPDLINSSRKKRIAAGSGRSVQEVNRLLDQLSQMNKMMKKMTKMVGKGKDPSQALKGLFK
ncbi:MAG: signal recognition particle protein [Deferribacteraceae bacterium]|jgi:signal recognition particle subunit SRP54|nr:signal recognition particle protein [Deferribacteraceae bacterium]